MNLETARTFQSRTLFRISHEPTAAARTLRTVIRGHRPDAVGGTSVVICLECNTGNGRAAAYPCATMQTVALELGVPLPGTPAAAVDG